MSISESFLSIIYHFDYFVNHMSCEPVVKLLSSLLCACLISIIRLCHLQVPFGDWLLLSLGQKPTLGPIGEDALSFKTTAYEDLLDVLMT